MAESFDAAHTRLTAEQADALALENAQLRGELVPRADIAAALATLADKVVMHLRDVPAAIAPLVHGAGSAGEAEALLRQHIDSALRELVHEAERVTALAGA